MYVCIPVSVYGGVACIFSAQSSKLKHNGQKLNHRAARIVASLSDPVPQQGKLSCSCASAMRAELAIATLAARLPGLPNMCGLVKWCAQASSLAVGVAAMGWSVEVAILTPHGPSLEDCASAHVLPWDFELERKVIAYAFRDDISGNASWAHIDKPHVARWLAVNLQKLQLLSLGSVYRSIFFTDWDVDPAPSLPEAIQAFRKHFDAFLRANATLLLGHPDRAAPLNGGVFLLKPACDAFAISMRWLRNGSDAVWDPVLGYDRVGRPSKFGLPHRCHPRSCRSYTTTQFARRDRWDWGMGSGADQGLLFYLFHVRLRGYAVATDDNYTTHHYQAAPKPWESRDRQTILLQWHWYKSLPVSVASLANRPSKTSSMNRPHEGASIGASSSRPTACMLTLAQRLRMIHQQRSKALAAMLHAAAPANASDGLAARTLMGPMVEYERVRDPVTKLRLRPYHARPVF